MNNTTIIICFIFIIILIISTIVFTLIKIHQLKSIISKMTIDIDRLKKVSVGNYVDMVKVKKKLGMEDTDIKNKEN